MGGEFCDMLRHPGICAELVINFQFYNAFFLVQCKWICRSTLELVVWNILKNFSKILNSIYFCIYIAIFSLIVLLLFLIINLVSTAMRWGLYYLSIEFSAEMYFRFPEPDQWTTYFFFCHDLVHLSVLYIIWRICLFISETSLARAQVWMQVFEKHLSSSSNWYGSACCKDNL